jgi:hypothetical protein
MQKDTLTQGYNLKIPPTLELKNIQLKKAVSFLTMNNTHKIFFKYRLEGKESEHIFGKTLRAHGTTH